MKRLSTLATALFLAGVAVIVVIDSLVWVGIGLMVLGVLLGAWIPFMQERNKQE